MSNMRFEFDDFTKYRGYLQFLARSQLSARFERKFDHSDIVQKTLLKAFTARQQFNGKTEGERMAWLRKILVRQVAQAIREVKRQKCDIDREKSIAEALDASSMRLADFLKADQSSPSQQAVRHENILIIAEAIESLPENQRQVILLRFWEGMTKRQVADTLGKSEHAVSGLLYRATKELRRLFVENGQSQTAL